MIFDLTVPLRPELPTYDGEPGPTLTLIKTLAADGVNVSTLYLGVHTGTHVDTPIHFLPGGAGLEAFSLEAMLGPCLVVELRQRAHVSAGDLESARIPLDVRRVILKTPNSELWAEARFQRDFLGLREDAARWLVERGVALVGIDYLSVDPYEAEPKVAHEVLLGAGVVILEGLDLRGVPAGFYDLACLPIRLPGVDGAPARVVLTRPGSVFSSDWQ